MLTGLFDPVSNYVVSVFEGSALSVSGVLTATLMQQNCCAVDQTVASPTEIGREFTTAALDRFSKLYEKSHRIREFNKVTAPFWRPK
jgi:hypothetical protein